VDPVPDPLLLRIRSQELCPLDHRGGHKGVYESMYGEKACRLSYFVDSRLTDGDEVVSLTRRPPLPPQRD
jgi:hypothetical protein